MGCDPISPVAPAYISTLLLPVGRIKKKRFYDFVARIEKANVVRLGDISADSRHDRSTFSPKAFPSGCLMYDFTLATPSARYMAFSPFELFREPLLVMCFADGQEYTEPNADLQDLAVQRDQIHAAYPGAALVQMLVFDDVAEMSKHSITSSSISVPPRSSSKLTTMKTIMCDVSVRFLEALSNKARKIQEAESIDTPRQLFEQSMEIQSPLGSRSASEKLARISSPAVSEPSVTSNGIIEENQPKPNPSNSNDTLPAGVRRASFDKMVPSERAKIQLKMRQSIVLGGLYLVAGRWPDALRELVENTNRTRAFADHRWFAKGLENTLVAMLLLAWNGMEFQIPTICHPTSEKQTSIKNPSASLPFLVKTSSDTQNKKTYADLSQIIPNVIHMINAAHTRSTDSESDYFPSVLYSESIIRLSCLYSLLHRNGGLLDSSLMNLLILGSPSNLTKPPEVKPSAQLNSNKIISEIVFECYPSEMDSSDFGLYEKIVVLSKMSIVLSIAGLKRKQAMVQKDILSIILAHPNVLAMSQSLPVAIFGFADDSQDGQRFMVVFERLLSFLFKIYGISEDMQHSNRDETDLEPSDQNNAPRSDPNSENAIRGNPWDSFGNTSLKRMIYRFAADLSNLVNMPTKAATFLASGLSLVDTTRSIVPKNDPKWSKNFISAPALMQEAQLEFMGILQRYLDKVPPHLDWGLCYWDNFLLRDIELQGSFKEYALAAISHTSLSNRRAPPASSNPLVIADKKFELLLTFQNPFAFDSFIERISFITTGPSLDHDSISFTLKANKLSKVRIEITASAAGTVKVRGCRIKIRDCREQDFFIFPTGSSSPTNTKIKNIGLDASPSESIPESEEKLHPVTKEIRVLPPQPKLEIIELSHQQLNLQLFAGELCTVSIKLVNASQFACDFLHVSFISSISPGSTTDNRVLPVKWRNPLVDESISLGVGQTHEIVLEILGVQDLATGFIVVDYANYGGAVTRDRNQQLYARQLKIPLKTTVHAAVRAKAINAIPLEEHLFSDLDKQHRDGSKFTLLVDFQNESHRSLWISLQSNGSTENQTDKSTLEYSSSDASVSALAEPGQVTRLALQLSRLPYTDSATDHEQHTNSQALISRLVKASWKDTTSELQGAIALQDLIIDPYTASTIREPAITLDITVTNATQQKSIPNPLSKVHAVNDFLTLSISATNNTASDLHTWLQIQPSCTNQSSQPDTDPNTSIVWTGPTDQNLFIKVNATEHMIVGAAFLTSGEFQISARAFKVKKLDLAGMADVESLEDATERIKSPSLLMGKSLIGSSTRQFYIVES